MKFNLSIIFILIICNIIGNNLYADESKSGSSGSRSWLLSKGAAAREAKRFTLQEWLENKERRNLMDMWLSINTPSPYEFTLSAEQYRYTESITLNSNTTTSAFNNTQIDFSAYARFVGISVEYSNNLEQKLSDLNGLFNIRLFGQTIQGSHLTLHYGLRTRTAHDGSYRLNQQFPAATLQLYLMKYFGIEGHYRSYLPYTEEHYGETSGESSTAGLFIEYGIIRLFGNWFQEKQNSNINNQLTEIIKTGTQVGIKFYF